MGLDRYYGTSNLFDQTVKECIKELINDNKDLIIEEIVSRGHKSLVSSKAFKEVKDRLKGESND